MSRQIQIRRGTAAEHEQFIGAIGEITVDTTNKTLRVHDGATPGGTPLAKQSEIPDLTNADYVVESQIPTAENNYTWYRKYKSGWVEQGGYIASQTISLPVEMSDANYHIQLTGTCRAANNNIDVFGFRNRTSTGFIVQGNVVNNMSQTGNGNGGFNMWLVYGICAN